MKWRVTKRCVLCLLVILPVLLCVAAAVSVAGEGLVRTGGGPIPSSDCISDVEQAMVAEAQAAFKLKQAGGATADVLFADPVGRGGTNSPGLPTNNYVDLDGGSGLLDYTCRDVTYNGHVGTDIDLASFYDMDEGVAILAAASGTVIHSHDGEYDRHFSSVPGAVGNAVIIQHADGSTARYWHFRKNSVRVNVSDVVEEGDTLGFAGSSGLSTCPHLHFEVRSLYNAILEPYEGTCQTQASLWKEQKSHILDIPFVLMGHGVTTLVPISWSTVLENPPSKTHVTAPGHICSWINQSSGHSADQLRWELWANGNLWNTAQFALGWEARHGWWYTEWYLPSDAYYYGAWVIKIYLNGDQIAEQQFQYDGTPNQPPIVEPMLTDKVCGPVTSEFGGSDPDGSIFMYDRFDGPFHGTITQFGGRRRKFTYVPAEGYVGRDSVLIGAVDDESSYGGYAWQVFLDYCPCCLVRVGDANMQGTYPNEVTLGDVSLLIDVKFISGDCSKLTCLAEADVNQNGDAIPDCQQHVTLADISSLIDYLFITGPATAVLPACL